VSTAPLSKLLEYNNGQAMHAQLTSKVCSRNHCFSGRAIGIKS